MKADLTRRTHQPEKHYARLLQQQGRVPMDADANEAFEIEEQLRTRNATDIIGPVGVPKGDSFLVQPAPGGVDLLIRPGTLHIDGILCESEATAVPASVSAANLIDVEALTVDGRALAPGEWVEVLSASASKIYRLRGVDSVTRQLSLGPADDLGTDFPGAPALRLRRIPSYLAQPDWPRPDATLWPTPANPAKLSETELPTVDSALPSGAYQVYLDAWARHITALEDPSIREVALGGPDTCTRVKTVWQAKLERLGDVGTLGCDVPSEPARGTLKARAKLPSSGDNPCVIAPGSSYRRLENQLYRVEIFAPGNVTSGVASAGLSFTFSRDNGSVVVRWLAATATELMVDSIGRDAELGLAAGQWVELIDDQRDLSGQRGTLVQLESVSGTTLTMKAGSATGPTAFADFDGNPRIRRWDTMAGAMDVETGWLALEDGVEVRFGEGSYRPGDYWTIPARTITADVEWPLDLDGEPLARLPEGICHHRAPLGVVNWDGAAFTSAIVPDCRTQFPPLTHICAEDVCVKGDPCGLGVSTVQEALEKLCSQQDLPFHNQHLHGWGVVCGLQVKCLRLDSQEVAPRRKVVIAPGYAIDPTGVDIKVDELITYDVLDEMTARGLADKSAVSLWIDKDRSLHLEAYDPNHKKTLTELLEGTILVDFWNECVKPVADFIQKELTVPAGEAADLVSPAQKRVTTLLNLLWQFVAKQNGRFIYLSGEVEDAAEGANHEDKILRDFYTGLRGLLQSETFCAMFDDVVFPEYDVYRPDFEATSVPHPFTIFGKSFHSRLRVHPDRPLGFTFGNGAKIDVFDLKAGRMIAEATFPVSGAEVQDVAFNPKSNQIYAAAWIGDAKTDSAIVRGTLADDGRIEWTQNQVTCSKKIVTLASGAVPANKLFAATRGGGVFMFDMNALDPQPPQVQSEKRTTGHLILSEHGKDGAVLYFGVHTTNDNPVAYNRIHRVAVNPEGAASGPQIYVLPVTNTLSGEGHDDIATLYDPSDPAGAQSELYVVAEGAAGGNKALLVFDGTQPNAPMLVGLEANTENRLAYNPKTRELFITYADSYHGRQYGRFDTAPALHRERHPLQIGASAVAVGDAGQHYYVLNWLSRTITVIPAQYGDAKLPPWASVIDEGKLGAYRDAVIEAFLKLIGRFLQYLKDCFCEHLLVDCPDPAGKKVYLADISVKDGAVYQICNFSHRRYVHTFPTVEYWMSIVPLIPLLKQSVESFCCSVLTGFFDNLKAPSPAKGDAAKITTIHAGLQWTKDANLASKFNAQKSQLSIASALSSSVVAEKLARPPAGAPARAAEGATRAELLGRPAADAAATAAARGIVVNQVIVAADSTSSLRTLASNTLGTARLAPGTRVDLVTDVAGRVLGFRTAAAAHANTETGVAATPAMNIESDGLTLPSENLAELAAKQQAELGRLDRELSELRTELATLKRAFATQRPA
jgi:hypothetical protein